MTQKKRLWSSRLNFASFFDDQSEWADLRWNSVFSLLICPSQYQDLLEQHWKRTVEVTCTDFSQQPMAGRTFSKTSGSWVDEVLRSMPRTDLALFERRAVLYFPGVFLHKLIVNTVLRRLLYKIAHRR